MLHWLNNKEMQYTCSAEASLGTTPMGCSEVASVDASDDSSEDEGNEDGANSDFDVLGEGGDNVLDEKTRLGESGQEKMGMLYVTKYFPLITLQPFF